MKKKIVNLSLERPKLVVTLSILLAIILGAMVPQIKIDTDPENMLPPGEPARLFHSATKEKFGLHDMIVVGIIANERSNGVYNQQTLTSIHTLSKQIKKIEGVIQEDLMSLTEADNILQAGPGTIRFEWLMNTAPSTQAHVDKIQSAVNRLPMINNTMVSGDGMAAGIYIPIIEKHESYRIATEVKAIIDTLDSSDEFHITGLPIAEDTFGVEMFLQMAISAPLAGLFIFVLLWYFFRSISLITAPMLMSMIVVIATMGLLIGMGFTVHIMSSMIPIFLMPIAVVDSVHLLSEFSDNYRPGKDPKQVVREVLGHLFTPMFYTSITSALGFASLALTPIPPVQVFGLYIAFGILLAFVLTVTFIPAYITLLSPEKLAALSRVDHDQDSNGMLAKSMRWLGDRSLASPKLLISLTVLILAVSIWGISFIKVNDNPVQWFSKDHPIQVADKVLNKHFAGTYNAFIVLTKSEGDEKEQFFNAFTQVLSSEHTNKEFAHTLERVLQKSAAHPSFINTLEDILNQLDERSFNATDGQLVVIDALMTLTESTASAEKYFQNPDALRYIEGLQLALLESGHVGKSSAMTDIVKTVHRELRGGNETHFTIPESSNAVAQVLLSYLGSHRPNDLYHMVTPDYRSASIWLQLKSGDNVDMQNVTAFVDEYIAAHPLPKGVQLDWAGLTYINVIWQDAMVKGMIGSLISAFVAVFIVMIILFRSISFGLIAMIPLTITITAIYGVIGFIGKNYDMPVAILSSLTLGLSVDFAIHFLQRSRTLFEETGSIHETLSLMYEDPARAISRNAIVVAIGFTPLLFAPLTPYVTVGAFLATIMALSCLVTLLVLPAVLSLGSSYLFKPSPNNQGEHE
ncbi:MAG: MMPL family transporter [Gammaproteobacteria bacterium]|nr:MMPL family transporter [Gammaproteobacteria bacterium]